MGIELITLYIVAALFILMAIGVPLGASTLLISVATAYLAYGSNGFILVTSAVTKVMDKQTLVAVPFFVFMANIMERSGVAKELFNSMAVLGGRMRGGVAVQTCLVAVVLAAMSGIVGGEIVLLGLIALPQMFRLGYDRKLSIGVLCASGSLATLIPPSVVLIVYGAEAGVSVRDLFTAGVGPGVLLASLYIAYVLFRVKMNPAVGPAYDAPEAQLPFLERISYLKGLILPFLLIFGVLGSIYGGIATVTESAAIGAVGSLIVAAARRELTTKGVREALWATTLTTGSILWLIIGAVSLVGIYNLMGGTRFLSGILTGLDMAPIMVIIVMMLIIFFLGTFLEWIAIVFITVPVFAPVVVQLGYDPVWFGILFAMNIQIYMLSPPFGPACFYLKSVAPKDVTLQEIFLAVLPFIGLQIIGLALVMAFPQIALWLPGL
ncbi:TRAP transporter large permease subunit [Vannielia litorea]|uniref:TRAP transporter large permease n=1 Tax=Vannielia litorea TaxID=1217970 RepID=UPI001C96AC54|nr:TRAP transporter large permease subunit [Vannielia litorea]MBY6049035.1 TRAP transporter large permease subunit [Vannielia litorea]MBY6076449.1 TRAP transporter large permease subunit [Vannielia litorea]